MHSTIISPGSRVSDFVGNLRAQKLNKAHTKWAKITGVYYFPVIWYCLHVHQQEWFKIRLIVYPLFIVPNHNLRQLTFSSPPSPLAEYDIPSAWAGLQFCTNASPPISKNDALSRFQPLPFHRRNCFPQPTASDEDLVPLCKIMTATGGRLRFHGRSSAFDADR